VELTAAAFSLAGIFLLPGSLTQPLDWLATPSGIALALYLGVVTAGLANTWLARGVHGLGPGPASTLLLADPVTASVLGVVVLHESVTAPAVIGIGLVLVGLALQTTGSWLARPVPRSARTERTIDRP
jgi:DME family drug/metabolite transporter